jgi:lipopolysaccharide exporter
VDFLNIYFDDRIAIKNKYKMFNQKFHVVHKIVNFLINSDGSLQQRALRSGIWISITSVIVNALGLVKSIVLARLLAPEIFGLMAVSMIILRGIETFTRPGIASALIHRQNGFEDAKYTAFSMFLIRGLLLSTILFFSAPFIAEFYEHDLLTSILQVIAIAFIINSFNNINTISYQKKLNYRRLANLEQTVAVVNTIVTIALAYYLRSVWALVGGYLITITFNTLLSYILIPGRPKIEFNKAIAVELLSYGKFITGATIVLYIAKELDNAILGKILGMTNLGYYVVAFTMADLLSNQVARFASQIMFPAYSELQNDKKSLRNAFLKSLNLVFTLTLPATVCIVLIANELILNVYGKKWMPAVEPLQILCIFGMVRSATMVTGYLLNGIGKPNIDFYTALVRLTILAIIIYPLIYLYGLNGAAISVTIAIGFQWLFAIRAVSKLINVSKIELFNTMTMPFIKSIVLGIVILIAHWLVDMTQLTSFIGVLFVIGFAYLMLNQKLIRQMISSR